MTPKPQQDWRARLQGASCSLTDHDAVGTKVSKFIKNMSEPGQSGANNALSSYAEEGEGTLRNSTGETLGPNLRLKKILGASEPSDPNQPDYTLSVIPTYSGYKTIHANNSAFDSFGKYSAIISVCLSVF